MPVNKKQRHQKLEPEPDVETAVEQSVVDPLPQLEADVETAVEQSVVDDPSPTSAIEQSVVDTPPQLEADVETAVEQSVVDDPSPTSAVEQSVVDPLPQLEADVETVATAPPCEVLEDGSIILSAEALASLGLSECLQVDVYSNNSVQIYRTLSVNADNAANNEGLLSDDDMPDPEILPSTTDTDSTQAKNKGTRWKRAHPENWKKSIVKKMRKESKKPKAAVCSGCRFKCTENFSDSDRLHLFSEYNKLGFTEQKNFLLANIEADDIQRPRQRFYGRSVKEKKKNISIKYHFGKDGIKTRVCKKFFTSTLHIGHSPVTQALKGKGLSGVFVGSDGRGRHPPINKTKEADLDAVRKHIDKFPRTPSHYTRSSSKREYLDSKLTIKKMHELYVADLAKSSPNKKPVEAAVYRRIFCTEYNLSFFKPKKDQCAVCSRYNMVTGTQKESMKAQYDEHIIRKTSCQNAKATDKRAATGDNTKVVITYDLQSVLQIPSADVSQFYYSRKLCMYNFTIHNAEEPHQGYCYCWPEIEGKRGSCEIGTCLYTHLKQLPEEISEVILYSDTCGGQNRNQNVAALLLYTVQTTHINVLHQKFLESGHSEMEVDSMHSAIERAKKYVPVYTALDWHTIFRNARRNNPYTVVPMTHGCFFDLKQLSSKLLKKTLQAEEDGSKLQWLKVKCFKFCKDQPGIIQYRYGHEGPYKTIKLFGKARVPKMPSTLPALYKAKLPVSKAKYADLLKLSHSVPDEVRQWYVDLPCAQDVQDATVEPAVDDSQDGENN